MTKAELLIALADVPDTATICISTLLASEPVTFAHNDIRDVLSYPAGSGGLLNDEVYLIPTLGRLP